jgi:hypothetical protein
MASPLSTGSKISGKLGRMSDCSFESQIYHASGPNLLDVHRKEKPSDSGNKTSILRSGTLGSKSAPQPTTNRNSTRDDSHDLDRDDDRSVVHAIFSLIQMTAALRHAQPYKPEYKPLCQTLSKPKYGRRRGSSKRKFRLTSLKEK